MRKGTSHLRTGGMLLGMVMIFLFAAGAVKVDPPIDGPPDSGADLIVIDAMKAMGPLGTAAGGVFSTAATPRRWAKINRDCNACHMADEKGTIVAQVQTVDRCGPAVGDRHVPYQLHRLPP